MHGHQYMGVGKFYPIAEIQNRLPQPGEKFAFVRLLKHDVITMRSAERDVFFCRINLRRAKLFLPPINVTVFQGILVAERTMCIGEGRFEILRVDLLDLFIQRRIWGLIVAAGQKHGKHPARFQQ